MHYDNFKKLIFYTHKYYKITKLQILYIYNNYIIYSIIILVQSLLCIIDKITQIHGYIYVVFIILQTNHGVENSQFALKIDLTYTCFLVIYNKQYERYRIPDYF